MGTGSYRSILYLHKVHLLLLGVVVLSVSYASYGELGWLVGKNARLVIEKLQVRSTAGAVGELYSPELALCADSYSLSFPPQCYCSGT